MKTSATLCCSLLPLLSLLLILLPCQPSVALDRGGEEEQCVWDCLQNGASRFCSCEWLLGEDELLLSPASLKRGGAFPFRYGKRGAAGVKRQMPFRYGKRSLSLSSSSSPSLSSLSSPSAEALEKRQFRYGKRQFRYGKRAAVPGPAALFGYNPQSASAYNQLSSMAEE